MKSIRLFALVLGCCFITVPAVSQSAGEKTKPSWSKKMQELSTTLTDLLPELASSKAPNPAATKRIRAATAKLKDLAHKISPKAGSSMAIPPDSDPSIPLLANLFEREASQAYSALEAGHIEYAKGSLRLVTSYCIACHTRTDQGPQFPAFPLDPKANKLEPFEKAQLFAAVRQFDSAATELDRVIADSKFATNQQLQWGRAVREAFTIAIRVKKDPKRTLEIANKIQAFKSVPPLFKEYPATWKISAKEWVDEATQRFETEDELWAEANRLLKKAQASQKYPLDHSADIYFLRLSVTAHELLARFPNGKKTADALFLLGNAYDVLDDHLVSPLPEMYYETCVRTSPHTEISLRCYQRYEANLNFGYTGSSGTSIPPDLADRMKELKAKAEPAKESKKRGLSVQEAEN